MFIANKLPEWCLLLMLLEACGSAPGPIIATTVIARRALIERVKLFELAAYHRLDRDGKILSCDDADRTQWPVATQVRRAGQPVFSETASGEMIITAEGGDILLTLSAYDEATPPARLIASACSLISDVQPGKTRAVELRLSEP